jgi:hypothetical protein
LSLSAISSMAVTSSAAQEREPTRHAAEQGHRQVVEASTALARLRVTVNSSSPTSSTAANASSLARDQLLRH